MWYYELNQQAVGPISNEAILEELKAGRINRQTLVWRQGWPQWRHLGETELAGMLAPTPPLLAAELPPPVYGNSPTNQKSTASTLNKLFWWWFSLNLFCLPYQFLILFAFKDLTSPNFTLYAIAFLCAFPVLAGTVVKYIWVYKMWQVVQDGYAKTTPGKAVGFMFIPYFNYYWFLIVYHGLSKDLNAYIERHYAFAAGGQLRRAHPRMVLSFVISLWASVVINFGLVMFMYFKMFFTIMNGGVPTTQFIAFMLPVIIIGAMLTIFEVVVYFDLFLSAKSILKVDQDRA